MAKNEKQGIKTLRELGVPEGLSRDFEETLKLLGQTHGDRVVGFTFITPDGARHELRLAEPDNSDPARDRAA